MGLNPHVSILVVLRNNADELEEPLSRLLEEEELTKEIIIVDDASEDETPAIVSSLLEHYTSDHYYFYPFEEARGRGNALNFAAEQINAPYLWIADPARDFQTGFLPGAIEKLRNSEAGFLYNGRPALPDQLHGQINAHYQLLSLVEDRHFIWKWAQIPGPQRFFDPYRETCHGLELALRVISTVSVFHDDPAFEDHPVEPDITERRRYFLSLLNRPDLTATIREEIFRMIRNEDEHVDEENQEQNEVNRADELYKQAEHQLQEGSPRAALNALNTILENDPDHRQAEDLKFRILNRLNRYVEAAEIKHRKGRTPEAETPTKEEVIPPSTGEEEELQQQKSETPAEESGVPEPEPESDPEPDEEQEPGPPVTLIIPTGGSGLPQLEACLYSVDTHCHPENTRVLLVDNASLDDTFEYLEQLKSSGFFNCEVIVNSFNRGFGASINQALSHVKTPYVCVMHNDVTLREDTTSKLCKLLEQHEDYALLGPAADQTFISNQLPPKEAPEAEITEVPYLDSFMMAFHRDLPVSFDESFGAAYFDDLDFCNQIKQEGGRLGVAAHLQVSHEGGAFLSSFGLNPLDKVYWRNEALFNRKWGLEPQIPEDFEEYDALSQLALIGEVINVFYPEEHLREYLSELMTSELRTELMQSSFTEEALNCFIRAMMALNERELMRRFEEQLVEFDINEELYYLLVQFYFDNNIFSRCLKYIDAFGGKEPFHFAFYRLKIAVAERDMQHSVSLLEELMEVNPDHPGLLKLAADIHRQSGNREEAGKFDELAAQLDPFRYPKEETAKPRL